MNIKKNYMTGIESLQPTSGDDYRYTESDYYYLPLMQAEGLNKHADSPFVNQSEDPEHGVYKSNLDIDYPDYVLVWKASSAKYMTPWLEVRGHTCDLLHPDSNAISTKRILG